MKAHAKTRARNLVEKQPRRCKCEDFMSLKDASTDMATGNHIFSNILEGQSQKEENQNKKRKRERSANLEELGNGVQLTKPHEEPLIQSPTRNATDPGESRDSSTRFPGQSSNKNGQRKNPFSLQPVNGTNSGTSAITDTTASVPTMRTPKASPIMPLSRRTVQLNRDDSSGDDFDYSPPVRRKGGAKFSSPRHTPKALVTSPKKVGNRVKRLNRKEELEEERMKLPIWTGMRLGGLF